MFDAVAPNGETGRAWKEAVVVNFK